MSETIVVYNSQPRLFEFGKPPFRILPGENDVPKDVLQANLDAPNGVVKTWFKLGYLQVRKEVKKARPLAADLSQISATKARELVKTASNPSVLKTWAQKESRSTVLAAITKRLGELETAAEPQNEPEGDSPEE
jgi:hypothetical protein